MNILLDYFFPISVIETTPAASTAFLKQVCLVVNPNTMTKGTPINCTTMAEVEAITDNDEAQQLFDAGMSRVFILPMDDLDLSTALNASGSDFFTVLISSDFDDADIEPTAASGTVTITSYANLVSGTADVVTVAGQAFTAQAGAATLGAATFQAATSNNATAASLAAQINAHSATKNKVLAVANSAIVTITAKDTGSAGDALTLAYADNDTNVGATKSGTTLTGGDGLFLGTFGGVCGVTSNDETFAAAQAAIANRCAFYSSGSNGAKNMCFAFGKLLSNQLNWANQQYITMPFADDVDELGEANTKFDDKVSFVLSDDEFGDRLALFACGGKAIVAPYILRNLEIDQQSKALQYISANEPSYTPKSASLLEDELQKIIDGTEDTPGYIDKGWLAGGTIQIKVDQDNFVASGQINVPTPRAFWRIFGQMTET